MVRNRVVSQAGSDKVQVATGTFTGAEESYLNLALDFCPTHLVVYMFPSETYIASHDNAIISIYADNPNGVHDSYLSCDVSYAHLPFSNIYVEPGSNNGQIKFGKDGNIHITVDTGYFGYANYSYVAWS